MPKKNGSGMYQLYVDNVLMVHGSDYTYGKSKEHNIIMRYDERYLGGLSQRETQYIGAPNWRRQRYQAKFDVEYMPLKYNVSHARDAKNWANYLLADCRVTGINHELGVTQGENLAKNTGVPHGRVRLRDVVEAGAAAGRERQRQRLRPHHVGTARPDEVR